MTPRKAYRDAQRRQVFFRLFLIIAFAGLLTVCIQPWLRQPPPLVIHGQLLVDHKIIVPVGGILLSGGSASGGAQ
jgi:hypothetical protein